MKKYLVSILIGFIGFSVVSCSDDDDDATVTPDTTTEEQLAADIAFAHAEIDEVYRVSEEAFIEEDNGRIARSFCASINLDRNNKTLTLDYGNGCTGPSGEVTRSGSFTIAYTGTVREPFSGGMTITFNNYTVNGFSIDGTTTATAVNNNSFQRTNNLTINYNGDQVSVTSNFNYAWTEGAGDRETFNEAFEITGTASGTNREGTSYSVTITEPWVTRTACFQEELFYPVSGISTITIGNAPSYTLDFGDGACDKLATVTVGRVTQEITLP